MASKGDSSPTANGAVPKNRGSSRYNEKSEGRKLLGRSQKSGIAEEEANHADVADCSMLTRSPD